MGLSVGAGVGPFVGVTEGAAVVGRAVTEQIDFGATPVGCDVGAIQYPDAHSF